MSLGCRAGITFAVLFAAYCVGAQEVMLSVRNIAALQAIDTSTLGGNNTAMVLGYYSPGDRGGGVFQWQPNSGATPDGGRYLVSSNPLSSPGRWERMLNGETANVKMWGAMGNVAGGFASPGNVAAANDDTVAIQNALNACPGAGNIGGSWTAELLIPAGFYKVTSTLVAHASLLKIRGESARMTSLIMPLGIQKDIFHTELADRAMAIGDGSAGYEENLRIEDLTFYFATSSGNYSVQSLHNAVNSGLVICNPDEGTTIRNVITVGGAYGIRCFGGGLGAPAAFRDVVCTDAAIAGLCVEPVPGAYHANGQVAILGITGDQRFDDSLSNASLVKFVNFVGLASIQDLNAEGAYGGGVIQHKFPEPSSGWGVSAPMGMINIINCGVNLGWTFNAYNVGPDFLVLKGGERTASVTMQNINLYAGNLIRDELTDRTVAPHDAYASGLSQGSCRVPTSYEALSRGGYVRSRLVVGDKAIYTFTPPQTGWYRVMEGFATRGQWRMGGKLEITSFSDSSELSVDVLATSASDAAAIDVVRSVKDGVFPPSVTKARAGVYVDAQTNPYGFVDIFIERLQADANTQPITLAYSIFDARNLVASAGTTPLLAPKTPLPDGNPAPSGYVTTYCVTNSLIRTGAVSAAQSQPLTNSPARLESKPIRRIPVAR
jgi:hypothetical protein